MNRPQPPFPPLLAVLGLLLVAWLGLTQTASAVFLPPDHSDLFAATLSPGGHQETDALPPKNRVWENFENPNEITPADELNSLQLRWESDFGELELASGVLSYADGNPISLSDPFGLCAGTLRDGTQVNADGSWKMNSHNVGVFFSSLGNTVTSGEVWERNLKNAASDPANWMGGFGMGGVSNAMRNSVDNVAVAAANTAPRLADDTISLFHQGTLRGGQVSSTRGISTSLSSDLSHYRPGGQLYEFQVPRSTYNQWLDDGFAMPKTDYHLPSGITTPEIRVLPPASGNLNQYLVRPPGG